LGVILSLKNYTSTSEIIINDSKKLFSQLTQELSLVFRSTYQPGVGLLELLSLSPLNQANTQQKRLQHIDHLTSTLTSHPAANTVQVAWPNDDFLIIRRPDNNETSIAFIAEVITTDEQGLRRLTRIYYDIQLEEISRTPPQPTDYYPSKRPWYQLAIERVSSTSPYLFYSDHKVGITAMIRGNEPGVVFALDITLEQLSETVLRFHITPGTEALLINAAGQTLAYRDPSQLVISTTDNEFRLANMDQLDSEVLTYLSDIIPANEQNLDFQFNGRHWIGSARVVSRLSGIDLYALILIPLDELLTDAQKLRDQSLMIAAFLIFLSIPFIWLTAHRISRPLRRLANDADKIARFDFSETHHKQSLIAEVGNLDQAMSAMKSTINKFLNLISALSAEQNLGHLLKIISRETLQASKADAAVTWLLNESEDALTPAGLHFKADQHAPICPDSISTDNMKSLLEIMRSDQPQQLEINQQHTVGMQAALDNLKRNHLYCIALPLKNRNAEPIGLLCLLYNNAEGHHGSHLDFIKALSGFAAVTLESRQLLHLQEALLNAFIKLIAGAIDTKSAYTGGHCQRVPEITFLLAKAACESQDKPFEDFDIDEKEWKALEIASWLHDCGKVTTPEYVVDKSTKLETIYDRINEIRTRFEVLKRDAEIEYWNKAANGNDRDVLKQALDRKLQQLNDDFAFVAECNVGGEFMADEKIARLQKISEYTWMRTLDDKLGISWEESARKTGNSTKLPVKEKLLADKPEHLIKREIYEYIGDDNPWGFKLDVPEHKYNRGELYNLSVRKGTLTTEERYKINDHMTQTIIMLEKLPYPKHLRDVPKMAGGHHETMDGKGYPRRLSKDDMPLTTRIMVIADIFEALTAADRPYKKANTLSESIRILSIMKKDHHIDPDLFKLFLTSGVYLEYAEKFLAPEQIDDVDINKYLNDRHE